MDNRLHADEAFEMTTAHLTQLLTREEPLPENELYKPTRMLLMHACERVIDRISISAALTNKISYSALSCRTDVATHGADCALQLARKTVISPTMRERVLVELWRKLTGDERSSPRELCEEARHIFRKRHGNGARTPSMAMRSWLSAYPTAMSAGGMGSTPVLSPTKLKHNGSSMVRAGAWPGDMRKVRTFRFESSHLDQSAT